MPPIFGAVNEGKDHRRIDCGGAEQNKVLYWRINFHIAPSIGADQHRPQCVNN